MCQGPVETKVLTCWADAETEARERLLLQAARTLGDAGFVLKCAG